MAKVACRALESLTKSANETIMTDDSTGQFEQSLVDVGSFFVSHAQAPKVMEPGECALDDPATLSQPAAVRRAPLSQ